MNRLKTYALVFAGCLAGTLPNLTAQTFNWGNTINPDGILGFQEMSYDSDGVGLDQSGTTFTFELGTFTAGFDPDASNTDLWGANWQPLDSAAYSTSLNYFTSSYTMQSGDAPREGSQAYIWVYNNTIGDETSEWFLATGDLDSPSASSTNWVVPEYVGTGGSTPPGTYDWRLSTANTPIWGGLNDVAGDGLRTVDPGTFELQTFGVPVPVPEPSTAMLTLLGLGLTLRRRRR